MRPAITYVSMPEGGAEREYLLYVPHNCIQAQAARKLGDKDPELDSLYFAVGISGLEIPSGIPFEVISVNPCQACGTYVSKMFCWKAPTRVFLG
mgnify:FL=1